MSENISPSLRSSPHQSRGWSQPLVKGQRLSINQSDPSMPGGCHGNREASEGSGRGLWWMSGRLSTLGGDFPWPFGNKPDQTKNRSPRVRLFGGKKRHEIRKPSGNLSLSNVAFSNMIIAGWFYYSQQWMLGGGSEFLWHFPRSFYVGGVVIFIFIHHLVLTGRQDGRCIRMSYYILLARSTSILLLPLHLPLLSTITTHPAYYRSPAHKTTTRRRRGSW